MTSKKILILGHGRHGKDTAAEYLRDNYNLDFISSSMAALDVIYPSLQAIFHDAYSSPLEAYADRVNHRMVWKELISLYNSPDKSALAKYILSKNDLYVGMRCDLEYKATKDLFDVILWVDASKRVATVDPSMKIKFDNQRMIQIDNNQDLQSFYSQLDDAYYNLIIE